MPHIYGEISKTITETLDILCDICGKSCKREPYGYEYSCLYADWGYESKKDTDRWAAYFCEDCSDKIKSYVESLGGKIEVMQR